jgi:polyisoprenyl-phosphate glycosyltransferase
MKLISVIVPVYNNEQSLIILYQKLVAVINEYPVKYDYQIIFINDGSKDGSWNVLSGLKQNDDNVIIINFSRNFGQMAGILAGWEYATGDCVINISADLQDPPEQITNMIAEWEKGNEIVISYREARNDSTSSALTSKMAYWLLKKSVNQLPPGGFDFALLGRKAMDAIKQIKEKNRFYQGDILWVGFTVKFIPYMRLKREHGKSGYTFAKRLGNFMTAFLNVSYFPIRLMSLIGFFTAFLGMLYSVSIIYAYLFHSTPFTGWAPIMMVLLIIGGFIMIMLGVIGEYLWRIYDEVKYKPNYIIKDLIKSK